MHSQGWRTFRHVARFAPETSSNLSCPHAFSRADPTSAYPGHCPRPLLLGASFPPGHTAWPPAPIAERAVGGLLRSVRPFSVALGRHCTPRPSYRVNTTYAHTTWPNGDVSLLGLPSACWQLAVRQVLTHDACVPSSKILTIATRSRRRRFRLAVYPLSPLALPRLIANLPQ